MAQARPEAAFEQSAGSCIRVIEIAHLQATQVLHDPRHRIMVHWRNQQMSVIGHEYPTMHAKIKFDRTFGQPVGVGSNIFV